MLYWTAAFLVISLIAAFFGYSGVAVESAAIAKILFFLFLILFVLSILAGLFRRGT